ncbi:autotransporter domain-containing protein [Sphingomonas glacialis]|uniref:Autotransporter domain-containing protein n=1 Tax=Sphingomonas glacialis TaxID=658225 RepID=A0A502FFV4_9SPHN|nr:autotransporter domain-containing protein [Sphingomonas glacialis]TPG48196.1 hypothetical protein EAH76_20400 [Sphingomonas glacialis]
MNDSLLRFLSLRRVALVGGVSAFAIGVAIASPAAAQCAPDPTIANATTTCSGFDPNGIRVTTSGTVLRIDPTAIVRGQSGPAVAVEIPVPIDRFSARTGTISVAGLVDGGTRNGIEILTGTTSPNSYDNYGTQVGVTIGRGGSVTGAAGVAILGTTGNSVGIATVNLSNAGSISGTNGYALLATDRIHGYFGTITNAASGQIGAINAYASSLDNAGLVNGGTRSAIDQTGSFYNYETVSVASITNSGTIRSSSTTATIAKSRSITNSGIIENTGAGRVIVSDQVTLRESPSAYVPVNITNLAGGTIASAGGTAVSVYGGNFANAGRVVGTVDLGYMPPAFVGGSTRAPETGNYVAAGGTITGDLLFGSGSDTLTVTGASAGVSGTIDGGAGIDTVVLDRVGTGSFGGAKNFERLAVNRGAWTLSGSQGYSGGTTIAVTSSLTVAAPDFSGNVANAGALTFDQTGNGTFVGTISGTGMVGKAGSGTATLGAQTYTGATRVVGGTLALTGMLDSGSYTITSGATLTSATRATISSTSTVLTIANGGTISNTNPTGRAIDLGGASDARTINIVNSVGGLITSADDAVRINFNPTGRAILINNTGTIQTTNGGNALDFDAATSGNAPISIINARDTGIIRSFGASAIRPGQGTVITNAGRIAADGAPNNSADGIEWGWNTGSILSSITSTISGARNGISANVDLNYSGGGSVVGRNGSGITSAGTGTVEAIAGSIITGQWDGVSTNGGGDGIHIGSIGTISIGYTATVQGLSANGLDAAGRPISANGVSLGGGTISSGGTVYGASNGFLISDQNNPGGIADIATKITLGSGGTVRAGTGYGVLFVGDYNDVLFNSGPIIGGAAGAINMGGGDDTLNLSYESNITGTVDGGAGNDLLVLGAVGNVYFPVNGVFAGAINFETLQVDAGPWVVTAPSTFANGIIINNNGGSLIGTSATLNGRIANSGQLTFDQAANGTFDGAISGTGRFAKTGSGTLTLGAQTYTGATTVTGGTLALTGNLTSTSYTVARGATLTSALSSTVASTAPSLSISNGGTISDTNATGRAIDLTGPTTVRTVVIANAAGGLITSADDAVRVNFNPTGGSIRLDNSGTIQSTNGGQAIDFNAAASGRVSIVINNTATGVIKSFGQDAIRPGQGAVVTNAGLIVSDGLANNSYDGIDWQASAGTVVNQATGTISGLRHGVTSDVNVNVTNAGLVLGRNGSGVGSDGTGAVVNSGTITGQWDGIATNGDGDGIDIDFIGSVTNSGIIQGISATGVDSGGRPNSAEGIAMGGGTIVNTAGGLVFGAGNAILVNHDTNPGGVADGATSVTNAGTIRAGSGYAISLVGSFDDTMVNSGTIIGGTAGAIDMGAGNDTLMLSPGSVITGRVDGGAGTDRVILGGTGTGSFAGAVNFETLAVTSGNWTLTAPATFATGTNIAAGASFTETGAMLTGGIASAGTLYLNQVTDGAFAGTFSGNGQFVKNGAGALTIGNQSFNGGTSVNAGRLILAGALPSAVSVANGATLAGNGTIAGLTLATGSTVAPGSSPGTIVVTGNFSQAAGATYAVEVAAGGVSDHIIVGGTATLANGALLTVTRDGSALRIGQRYTLLTAAGGIVGTYTLVQSPAGDTEFRLVQSANGIAVDLARTGASLATLAQTRNQAAVAASFGTLGVANRAYAALTLNSEDSAVRTALDGLSGEVHASLRTGMLKDAQAGADAVRSRMASRAISNSVWGEINGLFGTDAATRDAAAVNRRGWGIFGGADVAIGAHARAGIAGGYTRSSFAIDERASRGTIKTKQVLAYANGTLGPIAVRASVGYAWSDDRTSRSVSFLDYAATHSASYSGHTLQGLFEVGVTRPLLNGSVEPYAGIEAYRVYSGAFAETGAAATGLVGRSKTETFTLSNLGVRTDTPIVNDVSARIQLGWRHVLSDARPDATLQFVDTTSAFTVSGAGLSRESATLSLDLEWKPVDRLSIVAGYSGAIGGNGADDGRLRLTASLGF